MGVNVIRKEVNPVELPVEEVILYDRFGYRSVHVRPMSDGNPIVRAVVCMDRNGTINKFAVGLGDLRAFGEALIAIAEGK